MTNIEIVYKQDDNKYKNFLRISMPEGTVSIPLVSNLSPEDTLNKLKEVIDLDKVEVSLIPIIKEYPVYPSTDKLPFTQPIITWTSDSYKDLGIHKDEFDQEYMNHTIKDNSGK